VPKIPGADHLDAVKALERLASASCVKVNISSCQMVSHCHDSPPQSRQCFHDRRYARDAGLNVEQFKKLL
jgi:hypothetical protein